MSDFTQAFTITFPAQGNPLLPVITQTPLGLCVVTRILMTWPPGTAALTFVAVYAGGSPAYPNKAGQFLAFDDYTFTQEVSNQITSGQWAVAGYNTDLYDHTIYVVYEANYLVQSPAGGFDMPVPV